MRLQIHTKVLFLFLLFTFTNTVFAQTRGIVPTFDDAGAPGFVAEAVENAPSAAVCNDGWDDRFWTNGVGGLDPFVLFFGVTYPKVRSMAMDDDGNLYIGGAFSTVGNTLARGVAKWDGASWSALGSGLSGQSYPSFILLPDIYAVAVSGTDVYAAGSFSSAGGVAVNNIARWDGSAWSALGSGISGSISSIAASETDVYVGGNFTSAGGVAVNRIARWDGSNWWSLGSGVNGPVHSIAVSGTTVYVGGGFTSAGGSPVNGIAKWDGSNWSPLGTGVGDGFVEGIALSGTNVYVGGNFSSAGGVPVNNIARWDGTTWSALGTGISNPDPFATPHVLTIAVSGADVYAGGVFATAGGISVNNIARWDGNSWSDLGSGTDTAVYDISISGSNVYVGGMFIEAGGLPANRIAKWNRANWSTIEPDGGGAGTYGTVSEITISDSDVYVGGHFRRAGGFLANNIAKWNGSQWTVLGSGVANEGRDAQVYAIAIAGPDIYVGGSFNNAGGVPVNNIAKWDGSSWAPLGSGVNLDVRAIAVSGTDIYVGGDFTTAGGVAANGIAKWDGATWSAMGPGVTRNFPFGRGVFAIAASGTDVYVGGSFTMAGEVIGTEGIAKWDGSSWSALGSGIVVPSTCVIFGSCIVGGVRGIALSGSDVYAAGYFTRAGDVTATNIAKWDGSSWSALEAGVGSPVGLPRYAETIAQSASDIYVGGLFDSAGGSPANNIAKWNGSSWSALGNGVDRGVGAIAISNSSLFVGGSFAIAGCHAASNFSRYSFAGKVTLSGQIMAPDERGLRDAAVIITNPLDGTRRTVRTNTFGYYFIDGLDMGAQYTLSVFSKRYRFASREVRPMSDLSGIDFVGVE